ncbi:MAG: TRAM domain-containing protein, partial [Syntrophus sp. (in: bacteria)]|nr:TRAM domain-containing protein [Syntrophus sp. (in: bacteria)]
MKGRKSTREAKVGIGDRLEVAIDSIAFGGLGVGRVGRLVIFVPFAADGDRVELEIASVRKAYATGRICRILEPSPFRSAAPCLCYGRCGGCQYQHIAYGHQLDIKRRQVAETFARIGRVPDAPVRKTIPSPMPYGYRCKADFHVRLAPGRTPLVGYKEAADSRIVPVTRCEIVDESINRSLAALRKDLESSPPPSGRGGRREERVTLWSGAEEAIPGFGRFQAPGNRVLRSVKGKILRVPASGFFQANSSLVDTMVDAVVQACAPLGAGTL